MPFKMIRGGCAYYDLCCTCDVTRKAVYGRDALYPFLPTKEFGEIQAGGEIYFEKHRVF